MRVELHINGRLNIELTPETDIERAILAEMLASAGKGKAVKLEEAVGTTVGTAVVGVEK